MTYAQAVADAWTDQAMAINSMLEQKIQGGALAAYSGQVSDSTVDICNPGTAYWYPDGNYSWNASSIIVASLSNAQAQPGQVSAADGSQVLATLKFDALNFTGTYKGSQKCLVAVPGVPSSTPTENCGCNFTYTASSGLINYILSTANNTISVASVSLTNSSGGTISPVINTSSATGTASASSMAGFIHAELPNLFTAPEITAQLSSILNNYIAQA